MQDNLTILGIDAGGTFTDFVCLEFSPEPRLSIHKTLSTPAAPEQAILNGIQQMGLLDKLKRGGLHIIHGSTVATNAALEGNTARTAFITNYGFGDMLMLARQTRPKLYALEFPPQEAPVPADLCLETGGRLAADGSLLESLSREELEQLISSLRKLEPEAVAINLLFSFLDSRYEEDIANAISDAGLPVLVSRSSEVLPVYREYERGIATWLNASLGPVIQGYLSRLQAGLGNCSLQIMQSSGETIAAGKAAKSAVHLLLSGPAGGLTAMQYLGEQISTPKIISFDMGGTSTDVALLNGDIATTTEGRIGPYPIGVPMVDMHTIGAGGGSIAYVDSGGMLQVGPRSAGAQPGPACYGQGGVEATVTDANLVLGRLVADVSLAGNLQLDRNLAIDAVSKIADQIGLSVEETALGIVSVANEHMARAIREISVNRGHDPADFVLASFGGAGGLHVCALAEAMQMGQAIVPNRGGVLSALGMLVAPRGRQFARTVNSGTEATASAGLENEFAELAEMGKSELLGEGLSAGSLRYQNSADLRYKGQSYTLNVPWENMQQAINAFQEKHRQRYGYDMAVAIEIVNLRVTVTAEDVRFQLPAQQEAGACNKPRYTEVYGQAQPAQLLARDELTQDSNIDGPAVIHEYAATTYVAQGWHGRVDSLGNLILNRKGR